MRIAINSRTSGNYKVEMINNREHIVTGIRPIRGDSAMNRIFYPLNEVKSSFTQLDNLPAPNSHPTLNGKHVSAFHPLATNAHNIGGMVRSPKMQNDEVVGELVLDVEVANQTDDGKELIRRIEKKEKVGVSTGLKISNLVKTSGKDRWGQEYDHIGRGYQFDHVAILLNEQAAGDHAGTELVLNDHGEGRVKLDDGEALIVNASVNELREQLDEAVRAKATGDFDYAFIADIWPNEGYFIYEIGGSGGDTCYRQSFTVTDQGQAELVGEPVEVVKEVSWKTVSSDPSMTSNTEGQDDMDKSKLVLSLIANSSTRFTEKDQQELEAMSESALATAVVNGVKAAPGEDDAREVLTNAGFDFEGYQAFVENKAAFDDFQAQRQKESKELAESIVDNSEYTDEMLKGKGLDELRLLDKTVRNSIAPDRSGQHYGMTGVRNSSSGAVPLSFD